MKCADCGAPVGADAGFCSKCGMQIRREQLTCTSCGASSEAAALYCSNCGEPIDPPFASDDINIPADVVAAETRFLQSPGRDSRREFDVTDIASFVIERYRTWVGQRSDEAWWAFYGALLGYAAEWPHGTRTADVLSGRIPEALGDPRIRMVLRHLSKPFTVAGDQVTVPELAKMVTPVCKCGHTLDADEVFCSSCGKSAGLATHVQRPSPPGNASPVSPVEVGSAPPPDTKKWIIGAAVLGVVVLLSVVGTADPCARQRMDIGVYSYAAEMRMGASGDEVQSSLTSRLRCPLGFRYNENLVCPVHGAVTAAQKQKVFEETRGVYGY